MNEEVVEFYLEESEQISQSPSEIFRPGIVLPKSRAAQLLLEHGKLTETMAAEECFYIPVEDGFSVLWMSGIFQDINALCGSNIDNYEEETIACEKLLLIVSLIERNKFKIAGPFMSQFCESLKALCLEGIERKVPLYFIL